MGSGRKRYTVGVRLLSAQGELWVGVLDFPGVGMGSMPNINGIGMLGNRLVCVNFCSVMVPVAAVLMRP